MKSRIAWAEYLDITGIEIAEILCDPEFSLSEDDLAAEDARLVDDDQKTTFKVEGASGKWVSYIRPGTKRHAEVLLQRAAWRAEQWARLRAKYQLAA